MKKIFFVAFILIELLFMVAITNFVHKSIPIYDYLLYGSKIEFCIFLLLLCIFALGIFNASHKIEVALHYLFQNKSPDIHLVQKEGSFTKKKKELPNFLDISIEFSQAQLVFIGIELVQDTGTYLHSTLAKNLFYLLVTSAIFSVIAAKQID